MPTIRSTTRVVEQVQSRKCRTSSEGDGQERTQSTDSMRDLVCSITDLEWRSKHQRKAFWRFKGRATSSKAESLLLPNS